MSKQELIDYYGGMKEAAGALNIWPQTIYLWKNNKVPINMQFKVEVFTKGGLKVDEEFKQKTTRQGV